MATMFGKSTLFCSAILVAILAVLAYLFRPQIEVLSALAIFLWKNSYDVVSPYRPVMWCKNIQDKMVNLKALGVREEDVPVVRSKMPNILLIIADDLGYNDLSNYSSDPDRHGKRLGPETPGINSIREHGVDFREGYAGHSTCTPSRSAMYTGRFSTRTGVEFTPVPSFVTKYVTTGNKIEKASPQPIFRAEMESQYPSLRTLEVQPRDIPMLAEILQTAGYNNYLLGKWDQGYGPERSPLKRGFDESLCFQMGGSLYFNLNDSRLVAASSFGETAKFDRILSRMLSFYVEHNGGPRFAPNEYMTDYLTTETVNLIHSLGNASSSNGAPWYINLGYNAPHNPFQAQRSDYDAPELAHIPEGLERVYAAMVLALDRGVSRVLQALRDTNQWENTLVIFTSDNGGADYANLPSINAPFRGWKVSLFEGGLRVPFFLQWPAQVEAGTVIHHHPASHIDIVPTVVDIVNQALSHALRSGTDYMEGKGEEDQADVHIKASHTPVLQDLIHNYDVDGQSLLPVLFHNDNINHVDNSLSPSPQSPRQLFWRVGHYKALRYGQFKLQVAETPDKIWFHHLENDPTELHNIAAMLSIHTSADLQRVCGRYAQNLTTYETLLRQEQEIQRHLHSLIVGSDGENALTPSQEHHAMAALLREKRNIYESALCLLSHLLTEQNARQLSSRWPSLGELPICIDKHAGQSCWLVDDHVVIPN